MILKAIYVFLIFEFQFFAEISFFFNLVSIVQVFQLLECRSLLGEKFADYNIFKVILKRPASNPEGSIGVILSSAASGDQYISVSI